MSDYKEFGPFRVFMAKYSIGLNRRKLKKSEQYPLISDGCFGEIYSGDSEGARELAKNLMDAADEYDKLKAKMEKRK